MDDGAGLPEEIAKNYVEMGDAIRSNKLFVDYYKNDGFGVTLSLSVLPRSLQQPIPLIKLGSYLVFVPDNCSFYAFTSSFRFYFLPGTANNLQAA